VSIRAMRPSSPLYEHLYKVGCDSTANHHRLKTIYSLRCDGVAPATLLGHLFDAFRPGDDDHPASLGGVVGRGEPKAAAAAAMGRGKPDDDGVYTWRGDRAKHLAPEWPFRSVSSHSGAHIWLVPSAGARTLANGVET